MDPLSACVEKIPKAAGDKAGIWIDVGDDNTVMIKVRGFMVFPPSPGTSCGCGIQKVPALAGLSSVRVMMEKTSDEIEGFDFVLDADVGNRFARQDDEEQGEEWFGFRADNVPPTVPRNMPVELVFTGTLTPGATFDDLRNQFGVANNAIGFGKIGQLAVCPPKQIDPAPEPQAAPLIKVGRMGGEHPHSLELTVHDVEEGLTTVRILEASNMKEALPDFTPGTTGPVVVGFTMADGKDLGSIRLEACNTRAECSTWKADMAILKAGRRGLAARAFPATPEARVVRIHNGDPGAKVLSVSAGGQRFLARPMVAGQTVTVSIPGDPENQKNSVSLGMQALAEGDEALVLIAEPSAQEEKDLFIP
ncbi:MAG TPA: hypothetical protein VF789_11695 [Thermoanaerobaculia bacterium]